MHVTINDEPRDLAEGLSVSELLAELGKNPQLVAVERNGELVTRSRHADVVLAEGDRLEIVSLVGGG